MSIIVILHSCFVLAYILRKFNFALHLWYFIWMLLLFNRSYRTYHICYAIRLFIKYDLHMIWFIKLLLSINYCKWNVCQIYNCHLFWHLIKYLSMNNSFSPLLCIQIILIKIIFWCWNLNTRCLQKKWCFSVYHNFFCIFWLANFIAFILEDFFNRKVILLFLFYFISILRNCRFLASLLVFWQKSNTNRYLEI